MSLTMGEALIDRRPFNSIKWSYLNSCCEEGDEHILPMWIADMDLPVHKGIQEAVNRRAAHPIYGYAGLPEAYYTSFVNWMKRRHGADVRREWICFSPGIVPALSASIRKFSKPGDGIVIMPPVYHPFRNVIEKNGRAVREAPLINTDGVYSIDFNKLETVAKGARMLILCSPHNPIGRVWTELELKSLTDIVCRHDLIVVADEIHGDIVFAPNRQIPSFSADRRLPERLVACWAPSKTFNIPGLQTSYIVIPDARLRNMYLEELDASGAGVPNCFGPDAAAAAYDGGMDWLDSNLALIADNHALLRKALRVKLPMLTASPAEGTFLAWIDFRNAGIQEDLHRFLIDKAGLWLDAGSRFGTGGNGFMRMNIGCPQAVLQEAVQRLEKAINK